MRPDLLDAVLAVGATARLTRLVVHDDIAAPLRAAAVRAGERWETLAGCVWCLGFWTSAAVVGSWWAAGGSAWWTAPAAVLTVNYAAALLDAAEGRL